MPSDDPWWKTAVFYQIYPRSFADSDGDGVGDLGGIRAHLADLAWLGVDALWISPFYRSPMADFGYDVSDYCDVDPLFGTLEEFDLLVEEAHALGLRVIIDWVPNHTSDQHPWFVDAATRPDSAHRDWYVWRDATPDGGPPNNWVSAFDLTAPAWTFDERRASGTCTCSSRPSPTSTGTSPPWRRPCTTCSASGSTAGSTGPGRRDPLHRQGPRTCPTTRRRWPASPTARSTTSRSPTSGSGPSGAHRRLPRRPVIVGEVFLLSTEAVATYYGDDDELHLAFNFPPLFALWQQEAWPGASTRRWRALDPRGAWPTWVLSNHDNPRHRTRYDRARPCSARTRPPRHGAARPGPGRRRSCC
jgi:alpha-glucosidase